MTQIDTRIADILVEALPYIRRFSGMTVVVKYGGHAMVDQGLKDAFARDIVLMKLVGINPVVVHGGGPQINRVLDRMGIEPRFVRGMRMTDPETMDVVEMVLGGKVNKEIVALINNIGGRAVGLSGKDGGLITAEKMTIYHREKIDDPPEIIDPGMVGTVRTVDPQIIDTLTHKGFIPVIAPVGVGEGGETFNINADLVAAKTASALSAGRLIFLTDVDGVKDDRDRLISSVSVERIRRMIEEATITGGMIPKIECAADAMEGGVEKVHILNGRIRHVLLLELFTDSGIGTEVTR